MYRVTISTVWREPNGTEHVTEHTDYGRTQGEALTMAYAGATREAWFFEEQRCLVVSQLVTPTLVIECPECGARGTTRELETDPGHIAGGCAWVQPVYGPTLGHDIVNGERVPTFA